MVLNQPFAYCLALPTSNYRCVCSFVSLMPHGKVEKFYLETAMFLSCSSFFFKLRKFT